MCVKCGEEKDIYGGKYCAKDHFTCSNCAKYTNKCYACGLEIR